MDAAAHTDALNALCALLSHALHASNPVAPSYPAGTFAPEDSPPAAAPIPINSKGLTKRTDAA